MSIPTIKRAFISLTATAAILFTASSVLAAQTPYCIRVYCKKDMKTKIKNPETNHGLFLSAVYDDRMKRYYISNHSMVNLVIYNDCASYTDMWGTNAAVAESVAQWVPVSAASSGEPKVTYNPKCEEMERK